MIEFDGVNKAFAGQPAVKDLNLHLREGAFSVLIGTSGSGKSTTLKMINQLVEQDSGVIRFAGEDIRRQPLLALRRRQKDLPRGSVLRCSKVERRRARVVGARRLREAGKEWQSLRPSGRLTLNEASSACTR